ncbi:MAG: DUF2961 domain-containing protein [Bryobacteraceae bacterium]
MTHNGTRGAWTLAAVFLTGACVAEPADIFGIARLREGRAYRVSSNNTDPGSNDDSKRVLPGETNVMADLSGPGVVTHIWLTVAANEYAWPRLVRLRVYYDGSPVPSVDAPLGDFFAVGHGLERPVDSAMIRNSSSGRSRNSYWPMPFRKACRITVTNEGRQRVHALYYHVDWHKLDSLPEGVGYFHARYGQTIPAEGKDLELLNVQGRGQYAGTVFSVMQVEPGWFGEGDERIYVDGEKRPSMEGTGTEDYFNDAWSLRVAQGANTGVPIAEGTGGTGARMTAYRWHIADPIPFSRSFRFDLEHAGWTYFPDGKVRSGFQERFDLFSWVSFWYQQGIAQGQPEPPYGSARLPHGNARQIEAENLAGDAKTERGRAQVQKEVFWSRDILHFRADGPGASLEIPFDVEQPGLYEILAQVALAPDYGIYEALLDGQPLAESAKEHEPGANELSAAAIDGYHTELYVAEDRVLTWRTLTTGVHRLTFRCLGRNPASTGYGLGLDTIVLARAGRLQAEDDSRGARLRQAAASLRQLRSGLADPALSVREAAAWGFTQHPEYVPAAAAALKAALADPGAVVRGLAAVAFRNCGSCGMTALPELTARLADADPNVRIAAADAITKLGAGAAPALAALITLGRARDEHPHVLRSVAAALGAIGPAAREALPVLETMQQHIRVRWAARAAIAKIKGLPPSEGPEPGGVRLN